MIEFNTEQMTEKELVEAANSIFSSQEKDFEKIKSEKWYKTLFHAITLNQDGKKYAVRSIRSLAKLQQLFMSIYVKNYRVSHDQLNRVIEDVKNNSKAIKRIWDISMLNMEEQAGLETLTSQDSEILALFLGEYRDENGNVPDAVREYNRNVLLALKMPVPYGALDNHQIRELKSPRVVYRCFMEQCAIDGTIDTQEWSDSIYEDLKDFELSENTKNEIKDSVKYEAEIAGTEYFAVKYLSGNAGILDTDFELDFDEENASDSKVDNVEEEIIEEQEYTDEIISGIAQIRNGEVREYKYKNIHINSYIKCEGTLIFQHCKIFYNESDAASNISVYDSGKLYITNCRVICKGEKNYYFITGESGSKIVIEGTSFDDADHFMKMSNGYSFRMSNCSLKNSFNEVIHIDRTTYQLSDNSFSVEQAANFYGHPISKHSIFYIYSDDGIFKNNTMKIAAAFYENNDEHCSTHFNLGSVEGCTFEGVVGYFYADKMENTEFKDCRLRACISKMVDNCHFNTCTNIIEDCSHLTLLRIVNCVFESCYGRLMELRKGSSIEYCQFTDILVRRIPNYDGGGCILVNDRDYHKGITSYIKNCIFDGISVKGEDQYLVAASVFSPQKSSIVIIEDCDFRNCETKRDDLNLIRKDCYYYGLFDRKKYVHNVTTIRNCNGLDKVRKG